MNLEQIQQQWQGEQQQTICQEEVSMNTESLIQQFNQVDKQAKERSLYGSIAFAIIMAFLVVFDYFLFLLGAPLIAVAAIASWILILSVNGVRLWMMRQQEPKMDDAVSEHLNMKLAIVEQEKSFYLNLWKWLSLPLGIGLAILVLVLQSGINSIYLLYILAYLVFAIMGHNHCKKIVASKLQPLAEQLKAATTKR